MLRQVILLLTVAGCATADIHVEDQPLPLGQIEGLRKLLMGLDKGVIATCKIVFFSEQVHYDEADNNCKNFYIGCGRGEEGNLVTVDDEEKNHDLHQLLEMAYPLTDPEKNRWASDRWVWAGLRKTKNNNIVKPRAQRGDYDPLDWEWADGSHPTEFFKWLNYGERNAQPDQNSLRMGREAEGVECDEDPRCFQNQMRINHNGDWDDTYKFMLHPYACDYRGKYVLSNGPQTWVAAKDACEEAGLHLAKVRNPEEVEEMKSVMVYFLGAADDSWKTWNANNWIWLGGNDLEEEGVWKYLDGEMVETWDMPWRKEAGKDNAQNPSGTQGQHALAISRWGEFDDSFHDNNKRMRPFACQCPGS